MSVLVIAEHDNRALKAATLHAVTAAREIADKAGSDVHMLVAGTGCGAVAEAAAQVAGHREGAAGRRCRPTTTAWPRTSRR